MYATFVPENQEFLECLENISSKFKSSIDVVRQLLEEIEIKLEGEVKFQKNSTMYYFIPENITVNQQIIAFDLDWTLAYQEKQLFPKDPEDIQVIPGRREILEKLIKQGATLAIFTNQYAKSSKEKDNKLQRVANFIKKINLPILAFVATEKDNFRKPNKGMFDFMSSLYPKRKAIFVGDAAGRPQDFSDSDLEFAKNCQLKFYPPNDFFPNIVPDFEPLAKNQLVIFVGMPGSGKSSYYHQYLSATHRHINQDQLKTKDKVLKKLTEVMAKGESVVVDNTSPSQSTREIYYQLAEKYSYKVIIIYFISDGYGWNKLRSHPVPDIAYHGYFKKLNPPTRENTPGQVYYMVH